MANNGINYTSRNFADIRTDLVNMVKQYYPDIYNDFNDASVGMMLLELNAAVGDMLSFNTDRMFQETQIDYAQEMKSVKAMARTFGLKIPGKRPSVTLVEFSVVVPVNGDTFDIAYAPVIKAGSQVSGNGKIFELINDVDFSNRFSTGGIENRKIIPNFNSNNVLLNYTLTKLEVVINGYTRTLKRVITPADVKPFLEVILPEDNVISIDSVIALQGTSFTTDPNSKDFDDPTKRWYEVSALAEDKIFIDDNSQVSDNSGIKPGKWVSVTKKFITEYTDLGFLKMTFGGGTIDTTSLNTFSTNAALVNQIGDLINNMSLGVTPTANTTMFIKYRIGGGSDTNLGPNILKTLGLVNINVSGPDQQKNNAVKSSLKVNNTFPAIGGKDAPTVEEIRNMVKYNFAAQNRAVTIKDYQTIISQMPSKYGVPFRTGVSEIQNKISVNIISLDQNNQLTNDSTSTLRQNIANYLSNFRMINDYVQVTNGRIVNLAFQIDLFVDRNKSQSQIISEVINDVTTFMDINKYQMGENIYLSSLIETINSVGGVLNVLDVRIYNKVGGVYSLNEISQAYSDTTTRQINLTNNFTLYGEPTTMFEVKFPAIDIAVRVK